MLPQIHGSVHPRFERVRQVFFENFSLRGEVGASLCVYHRGERVVDLWGGSVDLEGQLPWSADDLTTIFSVTKGIVATAFLMLVDRGLIKYETPIKSYWPALVNSEHETRFAEERTQLTIGDLLNHRSGLVGFRDPLTLETISNESALLERLERETLHWRPGTKQGYHGVSYGLYAGALFKKITGRTVGQFLRDEIKGSDRFDLYLGLTEEESASLAQG